MDAQQAKRTTRRSGDLAQELAAQIVEYLTREEAAPGCHIPTQELADHFSVSRFPITQALQVLVGKGIVRHEPNRGFFLSSSFPEGAASLGLSARSDLTRIYFQLAEDRLQDRLPDQVSETFLRERYALTRAQLNELLNRISREGWAERRRGYGWSFSPVLRTAEAQDQTYRLRMAIEPAALLEPSFALPRAALEKAADVERALLAGAINTMSPDQLYERGARYHEMLAEASGNPFLLDTLKRVNQIRRLLAYRLMFDRRRYFTQAREHLEILNLLRQDRNEDAAEAMRLHLQSVVRNLKQLDGFGEPDGER